MLKKYYISESFFTDVELKDFRKKFGFDLKNISYSSTNGEIDFSDKAEKDYLLKNGHPRILARFFT